MVKRENELLVDVKKELMGGKGEVTNINYLTKEEALSYGRLFAKCIIPPGASIGVHQHKGDFEAYYILEGKAEVDDNGKKVILYPGDLHICKEGDTHGIENIGEKDLVYIANILFTK